MKSLLITSLILVGCGAATQQDLKNAENSLTQTDSQTGTNTQILISTETPSPTPSVVITEAPKKIVKEAPTVVIQDSTNISTTTIINTETNISIAPTATPTIVATVIPTVIPAVTATPTATPTPFVFVNPQMTQAMTGLTGSEVKCVSNQLNTYYISEYMIYMVNNAQTSDYTWYYKTTVIGTLDDLNTEVNILKMEYQNYNFMTLDIWRNYGVYNLCWYPH